MIKVRIKKRILWDELTKRGLSEVEAKEAMDYNVKRLKGMLKKRAKPCECCPHGHYYNGCRLLAYMLPRFGVRIQCTLCRAFMGISSSCQSPACPCKVYGLLGMDAIEEAMLRIELYEEGKL